MRRIALPLLAVLNAALLCFLAWAWVTPDGQLRNMRWQPPEPVKVDLQALLPALPGPGQTDTSQFLGMLERPLFSPTRRPPPPPPPPKADVPEPVNRFAQAKLTGVFEGAGVGGIIINYEGKDRRVPLNGMLDGWKLQSVTGAQATFSQRGQTRVVQLQRAALATYTGAPQNRAPTPPPPAVARGGNTPSPAAPAQVTPDAAAAANAPAAPPRRPSFGGR